MTNHNIITTCISYWFCMIKVPPIFCLVSISTDWIHGKKEPSSVEKYRATDPKFVALPRPFQPNVHLWRLPRLFSTKWAIDHNPNNTPYSTRFLCFKTRTNDTGQVAPSKSHCTRHNASESMRGYCPCHPDLETIDIQFKAVTHKFVSLPLSYFNPVPKICVM